MSSNKYNLFHSIRPVKKTRLSLGTKRFIKNGAQQSGGSKSSIASSLERRWSFMVTGTGSRNNPNQSQKEALNTIQDSPAADTSVTSQHDNCNIDSQNEYEAIKERVSAIESCITEEFTKLRCSLSNASLDSMNALDHKNGPERVLEKFERTREETGMMNTSPMTEQLAKRLSRGLNIRSSGEAKVCRSPSARKIGSIRRRSQENTRLTRTKSWHLGVQSPSTHIARVTRVTRNSPLQPLAATNIPRVDRNVQIARVNLKRGKPNSFQNGLRSIQKYDTKQESTGHENMAIAPDLVNKALRMNEFDVDFQNENWICADVFFEGLASPKEIDNTALNTTRNSAKSLMSRTKPARKRLYIDGLPTQIQSNSLLNETTKTPMLPPRLPLARKTPVKTPQQPLFTCRSLFTPLLQQEEQIAGRASIARLRNQNAGMVMAKAKLFDNLVSDEPITKRITQVTNTPDSDSPNKTRPNQSISQTTSSPRRARLNGINSVQRRHQRTPIKNTPISIDKTPHTLTEPSSLKGRARRSPALDFSVGSPLTRRMAIIDATPHSQRHSVTKPPRRIAGIPKNNCLN